MNKNANFGQKFQFFPGESKSFVTHITENPPRHLVQICFWSGIGQNVQKMAKMAQKDNGPGPGRNYGETAVFTFGRKVVFALKIGLTPKNHPK